MTTVILVDAAEEQLDEIVEWWRTHREASPMLVMDEFDRCVSLLESSPDAGARFHRSRVPGVRRLVMRRTKHHVYYLHTSRTPSSTSSRSWARQRPAIRSCSIRANEPDRDASLADEHSMQGEPMLVPAAAAPAASEPAHSSASTSTSDGRVRERHAFPGLDPRLP
jgi:plasmid stabilization system protein ParE